MLTYSSVMDAKGDLYETWNDRFLSAVGAPADADQKWYQPRGIEDLPNLKQSSERDFWGWRSSMRFKIEAWVGQIEVPPHFLLEGERKWGTLILYFLDSAQFIGGGFAVVVNTNGPGTESVKYFTWRACEHAFQHRSTGTCQHEYTCTKCGAKYDVDSSG